MLIDLQLCRTYRVVSSVVTCHVPSCSAQLIVRLCQLSVPSCLSSVTAPGQSHSQSRTIWLLYFNANHSWHFTSPEISGNLQPTEIESAWVLGSISQEIVFRRFRSAISTPVSWECRLGGLHFTFPRTTTSSKTFVDSTVFVPGSVLLKLVFSLVYLYMRGVKLPYSKMSLCPEPLFKQRYNFEDSANRHAATSTTLTWWNVECRLSQRSVLYLESVLQGLWVTRTLLAESQLPCCRPLIVVVRNVSTATDSWQHSSVTVCVTANDSLSRLSTALSYQVQTAPFIS